MKATKRTLTFAFVLAALFCLLVLSASAYSGTQYGSTGIYYEVSNGEATITDAKSDIKIADIPKSIDGYPVARIGSFAFEDCTGLTSVTIPSSVKSIGNGAFERCTGLTSITIPESVTSIGYCAFYKCTGLTGIMIPDSVTSISYDAFDDTAWYNSQPSGDVYAGKVYYEYKGTMPSNTSITIKDGTKGIADFAFNGCSGLTSVTIPDSVMSIGFVAFRNCSRLTSITIPGGVTSIGDNAFNWCTGLDEHWKRRVRELYWTYKHNNSRQRDEYW